MFRIYVRGRRKIRNWRRRKNRPKTPIALPSFFQRGSRSDPAESLKSISTQPMSSLFQTILYQPLFNALIFLFNVFGDLGIAIILLTLVIKLVLFWPSLSALKSQRLLQETQPKLDAIKKKYAGDKEEMGKQLMQFYKTNKVNPLSSCLPLLIQLPILIALYRVFFGGLHTDPTTGILIPEYVAKLYTPLRDIYSTKAISTQFLGIFNLADKGNYILAILAGASQFLSSRMMTSKKPKPNKIPGALDENMTAALNTQMTYIFPILTVIFGIQFPAGLTLYWLISTLFTLAQQLYFKKRFPVKPVTEEVEVITSK